MVATRRSLIVFLPFFLVSITALVVNVSSFQNNLSAIYYLAIAARSDVSSVDLPSMSPKNGRGDLLMAKLALGEGRYDVVLANTLGAVAHGDILAGKLAGQAYLQMGNIEDALNVWQQLGDVESLRNAGLAQQAENRPDEAIDFLTAAYDVNNAEGALALANGLDVQGKTSEAIEVLTSVLARYDNSGFRQRWMLRLVDILRQQKRWFEAFTILSEWEDEFPSDIYVFVRKGWVLYDSGSGFQAAAEQFEHVIALAPDNGTGYLHMGLLLTYEKQYTNADPYYAQAERLNPEDIEWMFARAHNLDLAGDSHQALMLYEEILQHNPSHVKSLQAIQRLKIP